MTEKQEENIKENDIYKEEVTNKKDEIIIEDDNNFGKKVDLTKNSIRKICLDICDKFKINPLSTVKGFYYYFLHLIIISLISFVGFFSTNLIHLSMVLLIVSLDAWSVIVVHGCPLTFLEKKYLNTTSCEQRKTCFENLNILYECDHEYEKVTELLINVWSAIATKILVIICLNTFKIKLFDNSGIYSN